MSSDDEFLRQFESQALPFDQWHHRAHLKVAYHYLTRFDFDAAAERMRNGIRAYNAVHHVENTATSGYHETMTMAWLRIIATTIAAYGPDVSAEAFLDAQPQLGEQKILRLFYSRERIMSPAARATYVTPDLAPLPTPRDP